MTILKARDVVSELRGIADPRVIKVIAAIAEENHEIKKTVTEMALVMDQLTDTLPGMVKAMTAMKSNIDGLKKAEEDDLPPLSGIHS